METSDIVLPIKKARRFLPEIFKIDSWDKVKPYFEKLQHRDITSLTDLENWLKDRSCFRR